MAKTKLARFILNNGVVKIDETKGPFGGIIGSEYCVRVVNTISDGDTLEYLVLQFRPLGRDGDMVFYRVSVLYDDEIIQCDYNGTPLNTTP